MFGYTESGTLTCTRGTDPYDIVLYTSHLLPFSPNGFQMHNTFRIVFEFKNLIPARNNIVIRAHVIG